MTVKEKVLGILKDSLEARESDGKLFEIYTQVYQPHLWVKAEDGTLWPVPDIFTRAKNQKAVERARREIQNDDGMYQSSKQKKAQRDYVESQMKATGGGFMTCA
jgi:hypothetical protein